MKFIFYSISVLVLIENDPLSPQSHKPCSLVITEAIGKWDSCSVFCTPAYYLTPNRHKYLLRDSWGAGYFISIYWFSLLPRTPPRSDLGSRLHSLHFSYLGPTTPSSQEPLVLAHPAPAYLLFVSLLGEAPFSVLVLIFMFGIVFGFGHISI